MKISFNINFYTVWGQLLYVTGSIEALGCWNSGLAREMEYVGGGNWRLEIEAPSDVEFVEYRYLVMTNGARIFEEWEYNHKIRLERDCTYTLRDYWQVRPGNISGYSAAFTNSIFSRPHREKSVSRPGGRRFMIRIFAPHIDKCKSLAITGNQACLGDWNPARALLMEDEGFPEWSVSLDMGAIRFPMEYKFLVVDTDSRELAYWEENENRVVNGPADSDGDICLSGLFFRAGNRLWRGAGTVIPVFSLRTGRSFGIGDLGDLYLFIDWIRATGQRLIQVLPMNDTASTGTWRDSYPYSAISVYALHPIYICLHWLGEPGDSALFERKRLELNGLEEIDYEGVMEWKIKYCRAIFNMEKADYFGSEDYGRFFAENENWLKPYAAYSYLRDKYGSVDFSRWGKYEVYRRADVDNLCKDAEAEVSFYYFLQYVLHMQFRRVSEYARTRGVVLKGDLPIGVNRNSVEVWTEPRLFNMNVQAGAPPDDFSLSGQNWSFPTYNWEMMERDGMAWWRRRFDKLSAYFDAFRIDHILGFFRIWEIPMEYTQGLCGHFNPALPLSSADIGQYGVEFNERRFTTPHIHERHLGELFGEKADEVCDTYLARSSSHHYTLKPFCNTQAKIEALVEGRVREGLLVIANETLFVRDPYKKDMFHPRISAAHSYIYNELSNSDRFAFDHLYWDFFYRRHTDFWKETAYRRLTPLALSTRMLACGEDLGMIPESVPEVMSKLQILSLEIERAPKSAGIEFTVLPRLPYLSVCTTSTHDMPPLRNWWVEEEKMKIQRYYNNVLGMEGEAPAELSGHMARIIVENHLKSPSMLTILPLQDWLATDDDLKRKNFECERINIPANPAHYWRYRMHINIEDLLAADNFNKRIRLMIYKNERE